MAKCKLEGCMKYCTSLSGFCADHIYQEGVIFTLDMRRWKWKKELRSIKDLIGKANCDNREVNMPGRASPRLLYGAQQNRCVKLRFNRGESAERLY